MLLIAADDLQPLLLLVGGKGREVGQDVEQHAGAQQPRDRLLLIRLFPTRPDTLPTLQATWPDRTDMLAHKLGTAPVQESAPE